MKILHPADWHLGHQLHGHDRRFEHDAYLDWLADTIKPAVLSFQDEWGSDGALVFWLPGGHNRIRANAATDEVSWLCHTPHGHQIDLGRILWGQANEYPQEILLRDGGRPAGLFHLRIT